MIFRNPFLTRFLPLSNQIMRLVHRWNPLLIFFTSACSSHLRISFYCFLHFMRVAPCEILFLMFLKCLWLGPCRILLLLFSRYVWVLLSGIFFTLRMTGALKNLVLVVCTLHCIALHCIALHCIALHCIALHT